MGIEWVDSVPQLIESISFYRGISTPIYRAVFPSLGFYSSSMLSRGCILHSTTILSGRLNDERGNSSIDVLFPRLYESFKDNDKACFCHEISSVIKYYKCCHTRVLLSFFFGDSVVKTYSSNFHCFYQKHANNANYY